MKQVFATTLTLRIDWSEIDLFGHVNNVMFMKYVQAARVNYWEKVSAIGKLDGFMLASTACQFKKPLHYPGSVTIQTQHEFIKNSSFGLKHVLLDDSGEIVAEAQDVLVAFDFKLNEKINLPDTMRTYMESK